jgi:hypothetical protein
MIKQIGCVIRCAAFFVERDKDGQAMDEATIGLVLLLLVVVGIVTITSLVARSESSKVSGRLLEAMQKVPLFRMLHRRQIDPIAYVRATDAAQIRHQIATCVSCTSTNLCDTTLNGVADSAGDISYCPNVAAIAQAKEMMGSSNSSR